MPLDYRKRKAFIDSMVSDSLLHQAIEWIADNLEPQDVFPDHKLNDWAEEQGFEKESE